MQKFQRQIKVLNKHDDYIIVPSPNSDCDCNWLNSSLRWIFIAIIKIIDTACSFWSFKINYIVTVWFDLFFFWEGAVISEVGIFVRVFHAVDGAIRDSWVWCVIVDILTGCRRIFFNEVHHSRVCNTSIMNWYVLVFYSIRMHKVR